MKTVTGKKIIYSVITIAIIILVLLGYFTGILHRYDNQLSDSLYQRGNVQSGNISIIQIDERALDELGPYQTWTRDNVANAIEVLSSDPDNKPSVIGVDILYIGNSNEESDEHLVSAAKEAGNVVFG